LRHSTKEQENDISTMHIWSATSVLIPMSQPNNIKSGLGTVDQKDGITGIIKRRCQLYMIVIR